MYYFYFMATVSAVNVNTVLLCWSCTVLLYSLIWSFSIIMSLLHKHSNWCRWMLSLTVQGNNDDLILSCCLHYCKDKARDFMPKSPGIHVHDNHDSLVHTKYTLYTSIEVFFVCAFLPERDYITFGSLLMQICPSVVCNTGAPYSGGWTFRQYFYCCVPWPYSDLHAKFYGDVPGEPLYPMH